MGERGFHGFASVACPTAVVSALSWVAGVASAGPERRYVIPVSGRAAAIEIAIGIAVGVVTEVAMRRISPRPRLVGPAVLACAAAGLYAALFVEANELLPFGGAAVVMAAAVGLGFAVDRLGRSRRVSPSTAAAWSSAPLLLFVAAVAIAFSGGNGPTPVSPPAGTHPDVLLVVLDTTRADRVPAPSGSKAPTPALARLAAEGTRFTNAFATSSWTVPTHASLFTGLTPQAHGCDWESPYLPPQATTIAERLGAAGYRTLGFSANPWVAPEFGFDRGFERFETVDSSRRPLAPWSVRFLPWVYARVEPAWLFDDDGGFALASDASRALAAPDGRPTFVFVNLLESHIPYHAPAPFVRSLLDSGWDRRELAAIDQSPLRGLAPGSAPSGRELDGLRGLYDAAVAYDDHLVGRLVETLRATGRLDRTAIVVVGDHGENLGDHPPLDHQLGVWDSLLHVPLIVRLPGTVPAGRVDDRLISGVDVAPAIAALAGLSDAAEPGPILGGPPREVAVFAYARPIGTLDAIRDRLHLDPSPWDRRWSGVRTARLKYEESSSGGRAAYDTEVDPLERTNLLVRGTAAPPEVEALATRLRGLAGAPPRRAAPTITDETRRKLRSLGYLH